MNGMNGPEHGDPPRGVSAVGRSEPRGRSRSVTFAAPLGASGSGRLILTSGVSGINLRADGGMRDLYRASFEPPVPTVMARKGTVTIRYPRSSILDWLQYRNERSSEIALNARVPWDIEVRGGASRFTADLRGLRLRSLELAGANRVGIVIPRPSGTLAVRIMGGASNVAVQCPQGVAARVHVLGGVTNLTFGEQHFGAVGGEVDVRSPGYNNATDRYEIAITGGANGLLVGEVRSDHQTFMGGS